MMHISGKAAGCEKFFFFGCFAALTSFVSISPNATRFFVVVGGNIGEGSLLAW